MEQKLSAGRARLKICIVGGGYSGVSIAASLARKSSVPLDITLIDQSGKFGVGEAYRTPYPHHLLNVRAKEMSAFDDESDHFIKWLHLFGYVGADDTDEPISEQFVPRYLYRHYLAHILSDLKSIPEHLFHITYVTAEVVDLYPVGEHVSVVFDSGVMQIYDKVVLAIGNGAAANFPFQVDNVMHCVRDAWDYRALSAIPSNDTVLIVGTGLSMVDAVLTLYHQSHRGKIYAISRHGLLPLPHASTRAVGTYDLPVMPANLREVMRIVREASEMCVSAGGNWRAVMNALRAQLPSIWRHLSVSDRKQFLRHVLPYWNIHRHRVHEQIAELLASMITKGQLNIVAGRIRSVDAKHVNITRRRSLKEEQIDADWLINCTGPAMHLDRRPSPLVQSLMRRGLAVLDDLGIGFSVSVQGEVRHLNGQLSSMIYALGPPIKGEYWECTAVPDIRKQVIQLVDSLLTNASYLKAVNN